MCCKLKEPKFKDQYFLIRYERGLLTGTILTMTQLQKSDMPKQITIQNRLFIAIL